MFTISYEHFKTVTCQVDRTSGKFELYSILTVSLFSVIR